MTYFRPARLGDALSWLKDNNGRIAAGCTDLFAVTQDSRLQGPVLDLTGVNELRGISEETAMWRFGATTTWSDVVRAELPAAFDALKCAAREIGSLQIQNAGTVAGNLCNASPAADGIPPFLILDASIEIATLEGRRTLPLTDFITGPRQTTLGAAEIVTAILVPKTAAAGRSAFRKLGARRYLVISIAMVAARLVLDGTKISSAAVAVGACGPVATRLEAVERALAGQDAESAAALVTDELVARYLSPIGDIRADAGYRIEAATELVRRAIGECTVTDTSEVAA
ncbi:MAG: FAD binding domain-containing protein [Notoacmeibacter sp.]|nr:FAD binding domain-containing protein [Notoacmeibacter sp.]